MNKLALFTLPALAQSSTPNFLFLMPDEWRWDWAGFDTPSLRTPTLTSLAKEGVRFTHAYVPSPVCDPSRACMASGKEYDETGVPNNNYDFPTGDESTWYALLKTGGYHTMTAGKDDLTKATGINLDGAYNAEALGFSDWIRTTDKDREVHSSTASSPYSAALANTTVVGSNGSNISALLAEYRCVGESDCCEYAGSRPGGYDDCYVPDAIGARDDLYIDNWVAASAIELLERMPSGTPWLLHVSFPGPHPPFIITEAMNKSIASRTFPAAVDNTGLDATSMSDIRKQYAAEVENLDSLFAKIIAKVKALGDLDNTVIVVASDHGDELGDHDAFGKEKPWEGSMHVPLIIKGPNIASGKVVDDPVATLDIAGTFFDYAGVTAATNMTTQSLRPLLSSSGVATSSYRSHVSSGLDGNFGNFRVAIKKYNSSTTLKFVCCDTTSSGGGSGGASVNGCPTGPSNIDAVTTSVQALLFDVKADSTDMSELLAQGVGKDEALAMAKLLPSSWVTKCTEFLSNSSIKVVSSIVI
jgi:arylsulfatase A-like enzyme